MKHLLVNIILTFIWLAMTGQYSLGNFFMGFTFSYLAIWLSTGLRTDVNYFSKFPRIIQFIFFFTWQLLKSNIILTWDILTPTHLMKPAIIAIPLSANTNFEITLLANLITLTPGTLTLDVSSDKKVIYVHSMYVPDEKKFIEEIKNGLEKKLLDILR